MWSPSRLAELAGTSRRTVRHYLDVGLLPEPQRQRNGYQRFGVDHLIRLLRIRRLTQLGLTLPQIAELGDSNHLPAAVLRDLDTTITREIERLRQTRAELATMLEHAAPLDLPAPLAGHVAGLPAAERALVVVLTRVLDPGAVDAYVALLPAYRANAAVVAFDNLPDDADEPSRVIVAAGIADHLRHLTTSHHRQVRLIGTNVRAAARTRHTVRQAVDNLYNPAQTDVLTRARHVR